MIRDCARRWRRAAAGLVLLAPVAGAVGRAQERDPSWHVVVQTYSWHEGGAEGVTDATPGLGVIRRTERWLAGGGLFRNSIGRWAGYVYLGWQRPVGRVRVGGIGGVTHNYAWNNGGIVPLAAAVVTVPVNSRLSLEVVGIPPISHVSYATVNVSLSWRFH